LAWTLGFTAAISLNTQFSGDASLFNSAYAEYLATLDATTAASLPLVAAKVSAAYRMLWVYATFIGYSVLATYMAQGDIPSYLEPIPDASNAFGFQGPETFGMTPATSLMKV